MDLTKTYPFLIAIYLLFGLLYHNSRKDKSPKFLPGKRSLVGFTNYGILAGIGVFLAAKLVTRCDLDFMLIALIVVLPTILRWVACSQSTCTATYNVTLTYALVIPLVLVFFPCKDVSVIMTALAIGTAFGRLGCACAGCCAGPQIDCEKRPQFVYHDPEQGINQENGQSQTCTMPTVIIEAILQFVIAGLCMHFPQYAPQIFGVGTGLLVFATESWRRRLNIRTTTLILFLLPLFCGGFGSVTGPICQDPTKPKILGSLVLAIAVALVLSRDILKPKDKQVTIEEK